MSVAHLLKMLTVRLKLYVVDMTPDYLDELFRSLPDYISYEYETYENGSSFVDSLHRKLSPNELHVVLLAYQFGYGSSYVMNGLEVLEAARARHPILNFVMLAQNKELEYTMKAKSLGAYAVINRDQLPLQINSLLMGLIAEQRIPLARHHLLICGTLFSHGHSSLHRRSHRLQLSRLLDALNYQEFLSLSCCTRSMATMGSRWSASKHAIFTILSLKTLLCPLPT